MKFRFICEEHFPKKYYLEKKLSTTAVPYVCDFTHAEQQREPPIADYSASSRNESEEFPVQSSTSPREIHFVTPEKEEQVQPIAEISSQDLAFIQCASDMPSPSQSRIEPDTPRKIYLKRKLFATERKLQRTSATLKTKTYLTVPRTSHQLSPFNRGFISMQLYHKRNTPWTSEEKKVAISLFYKSPSTYRFLRSKGCILPSPSTIFSWVN